MAVASLILIKLQYCQIFQIFYSLVEDSSPPTWPHANSGTIHPTLFSGRLELENALSWSWMTGHSLSGWFEKNGWDKAKQNKTRHLVKEFFSNAWSLPKHSIGYLFKSLLRALSAKTTYINLIKTDWMLPHMTEVSDASNQTQLSRHIHSSHPYIHCIYRVRRTVHGIRSEYICPSNDPIPNICHYKDSPFEPTLKYRLVAQEPNVALLRPPQPDQSWDACPACQR